MLIARQSTARTVTIGPVLDSSGVAVTTAVVGDFKIAKNGGAPAALNGSATLTHRNTGHYSLALTASDTDTVGQAEVVIDATTNACPMKEITIVEEAVYDAMFAASAAGYQVPIWSSASATVSLTGTTVATVTTTTTATTATNVTTVNGLAAGVITATSIAADAITAAKIADGAIDSATFAAGAINAAAIADGAIDSATFASGAFDAVWSVTTRILTAATNITSTGGTTVPQTGDSFARIGAAGASLTDLGGMSTTMKAQVQTEAEDALVTHRLDELLNADSDIDGAAPPTVGSVFHELMSKTVGSFTYDQTTDSNEALRDRGDAAWVTATGFSTHTAADVWSVATRVLTAGTNIALAKGTGVTGFNDVSTSDVQTSAAAALTAYDPPTNAEMEARTLAAASYATASNVSAILTTAMTESYATDGSAMTAAQALYMIWSAIAEVTVSSTTLTCKKLDGSTTAMTFTLDDATTPTSRTRAS